MTTYASQYPPEHSDTYVKATSSDSYPYRAFRATDPANSLNWKKGSTVEKKAYSDGLSYLSSILGAVGVTESNLLGFTYLPFTDRLNKGET